MPKAIKFKFINQNFYIGINGFLDLGQAVTLVPIEDQVSQINDAGFVSEDYFDIGEEGLHVSYGAGLKIVMNQNFIISVDYGMAADDRDGSSGMYIGLNYLF